ncbi:MAG: DUF5659 domain-containing protein [Atribacterota bacterium]|nr:DUF5659 domain-containing protein [Atribacterota bacterium]
MIDLKYRTSDLWLATYLITRGATLDRLLADPDKPRHILFCIEGNDIDSAVDEYHKNGTAPVKQFKDIFFNLKKKMFKLIKEQEEKPVIDDD